MFHKKRASEEILPPTQRICLLQEKSLIMHSCYTTLNNWTDTRAICDNWDTEEDLKGWIPKSTSMARRKSLLFLFPSHKVCVTCVLMLHRRLVKFPGLWLYFFLSVLKKWKQIYDNEVGGLKHHYIKIHACFVWFQEHFVNFSKSCVSIKRRTTVL